tara:strand:- start:5125 stop:5775 length:651 start_codon:yes stop_codon:yes gene_type:complete
MPHFYYRCGCHGDSENCPLHGASGFSESDGPQRNKKYTKRKNVIYVNNSLKLDFAEVLVFDCIGTTKPVKDLKDHIKKARTIIILTDRPKKIKAKIRRDCIEVEALAMFGNHDPSKKHLSQLIFTDDSVDVPAFCYIGSSSMIERYWLDELQPKSIAIAFANSRRWFDAACLRRVPLSLHTHYPMLARQFVDAKFNRLLNCPEEKYEAKLHKSTAK